MASKISKIFGKAETSDSANEEIKKLLTDGEKVLKSFQFLVDEIVLTDYGIYRMDKRLVGKKKEIKFISYYTFAGVTYEKAGTVNLSSRVVILNRNPSLNLSIKVSKDFDSMIKELLDLLKENYIKSTEFWSKSKNKEEEE